MSEAVAGTIERKPTYTVEAEKMLTNAPRELWAYRELFLLLVKRDFIASYKQTVLGPIWFVAQPLFASLVYTAMFSQIARLPTTNLPPIVFYMSGIIVWNYFSNCVIQVSHTFLANSAIFRKIYFPRVIAPLSQVTMNFINFLAQLLVLFFVVWLYQLSGWHIQISFNAFNILFVLVGMAVFAFGLGTLIAAATVKYRDLTMVVGYSLSLWMFGSYVIYPRAAVPANLQQLELLNPMASMVEWYRHWLFGTESAEAFPLIVAAFIIVIILILGVWAFRRAEQTFTDAI